MTMKVKELAEELGMTSKELIEKADSMGIEAKAANSNLEEIDVKSIKNSVKAKKKKGAETKIVRVRSKKSEEDTAEPKVKVKAAKVKTAKTKIAENMKKVAHASAETRAAEAKTAEKTATRKPPIGRPVPKSEAGTRAKPPIGKPVPKAVVKKAEEEQKPFPKKAAVTVKAEEESAQKAAKKEAETAAAKTAESANAAETAEKKTAAKPAAAKTEAAGKQETGAADKKAAADIKPEDKKAVPAEATRPAASKEAVGEKLKKEKPSEEKQRTHIKIIKKAQPKDESKSRPERPAGKPAAKKEAAARPEHKKTSEGTRPSDDSSKSGRKTGGSKRGKDKEYDKFSKLRKDKNDRKEGRSLEKKVKKKHIKQKPVIEPEVEAEPLPVGTKVVNVPITIAGFCEQVGVSVSKVILSLLKMGVVANQNQNIDDVTVAALADELGIRVVIGNVETEEEEEGLELFEDKESDLVHRPPIITVMGHVDHGKTSLLDAIRKTNVTEQESGGITQHIGASEVEINGQKIVFLDTPGHEAFTAMRARGADITDIAVLVVAADDSVKPQTVESISHAKAAGVPIIVAINKMDKPGADPDRVKKDLTEHGIVVEDWGGDTIAVPVSAKSGEGITNLLEMILLQAEVLELKANPDRLAMGTVIEARLDKAKGPVATLLVTNGTLKAGQSVVAGTCAGRIRHMVNHTGDTIAKAGPATAVEILGLTDVPAAGDEFNAVSEDKTAKEIAEKRKLKQREEVMARTSSTTLEELFSSIKEGEVKELNMIVKADVRGSVGAVTGSLEKLSNDEVKVKIIHSGVGAITESDVTLAGTSDAVIIGFNVRPSSTVQQQADRENVQIRTYRVIYNIIDDVRNAMKGMLDPEFKEVVLGEAEVRDTFKVPGTGIIAGAYVTNGKVMRNAQARLVRDGIVIHEGDISSLRRFKDDAKEVAQGYECGIGIADYNDLKEGDVIECYRMEEVERE